MSISKAKSKKFDWLFSVAAVLLFLSGLGFLVAWAEFDAKESSSLQQIAQGAKTSSGRKPPPTPLSDDIFLGSTKTTRPFLPSSKHPQYFHSSKSMLISPQEPAMAATPSPKLDADYRR